MDPTPARILIVDDEPSLLRMMGLYLTRRGFAVETTDSTDQAWAMVEANPSAFSAAVLDGSMPGMSMHDLARRLLQANPALCVLAASGYPVDMAALEVHAPGRVASLLKPFTPEMLAGALRRLIGTEEEKL